jgi:D-2-hydroxyacid dehydrogenase (NADP+)
MSRKILYIGAAEADAAQFERRAREDFPAIDLFASNDRKMALQHAASAHAVIGHHFQFDEDLLQRATDLKWIQSLTTGTDAILKLKSLRPEVLVTSTRGMHGPQMSELVFLQMLALSRDFPRMQRNQAAHRWERWPQPLLVDKTIVIVGIGAIAEMLAQRSKVFGMHVVGISESTRQPPGFDAIIPRHELPRGAALADFLVLIVPHSPKTENLIDASVLRAMKPSAYLINVARGGVLDEKALLAALRAKQLAGAALDVFRASPLSADDPLWEAPNVLITSQIGGMSDVYLQQAYPIVRDNLRLFLSDKASAMHNIVAH